MSNHAEIPLHQNTIEVLRELEKVFSALGVEYYIAGALARDIYIEKNRGAKAPRQTNDVDLAVHISSEEKYHEVMDALVATGLFERDEIEIVKLRYRRLMEVDLIPFGEIEDGNREVKLTKPKAFTLQMPGFLEAFPFIEKITSGGLTLNTCSIEGLVMLKFIAWDDRPVRTKDITDIEHIIDVYFDWNGDEIYSEHNDLFDEYDVNDTEYYLKSIAAHVIGSKMKTLLSNSPDILNRMKVILNKRADPTWKAALKGLS